MGISKPFTIGVLVVLLGRSIFMEPALSADFLRTGNSHTGLDDYIAAPDPSFQWKIVDRHTTPECTQLVVDLTSQTWRTPDEVDRQLWHHWLTFYVPTDVKFQTALLLISGDSNSETPPAALNPILRKLAIDTHSVTVELANVPNQPLFFAGDGKRRTSDALLAYTWDQYLRTADPTWVGQLPMVKSAVRAMDAVQQTMAQERPASPIKKFVVTGASKRGWTAWLTAAVDTRVTAIIPLVIDILNISKSIPHHHDVYGFWAPALDDYARLGLPDRLDNPESHQLVALIDPYEYRDRLTIPKCIINASGDEFFVPESSQFYFDDLGGEKHLTYAPNTGHSLEHSTALETLAAYYHALLEGIAIPQVTWSSDSPGRWQITTDQQPEQVLLWQAENEIVRDFRHSSIGKAYKSRSLEANGEHKYLVELRVPQKGWSASFVELTYDIGTPGRLRLTTPVWITPDTLPVHK